MPTILKTTQPTHGWQNQSSSGLANDDWTRLEWPKSPTISNLGQGQGGIKPPSSPGPNPWDAVMGGNGGGGRLSGAADQTGGPRPWDAVMGGDSGRSVSPPKQSELGLGGNGQRGGGGSTLKPPTHSPSRLGGQLEGGSGAYKGPGKSGGGQVGRGGNVGRSTGSLGKTIGGKIGKVGGAIGRNLGPISEAAQLINAPKTVGGTVNGIFGDIQDRIRESGVPGSENFQAPIAHCSLGSGCSIEFPDPDFGFGEVDDPQPIILFPSPGGRKGHSYPPGLLPGPGDFILPPYPGPISNPGGGGLGSGGGGLGLSRQQERDLNRQLDGETVVRATIACGYAEFFPLDGSLSYFESGGKYWWYSRKFGQDLCYEWVGWATHVCPYPAIAHKNAKGFWTGEIPPKVVLASPGFYYINSSVAKIGFRTMEEFWQRIPRCPNPSVLIGFAGYLFDNYELAYSVVRYPGYTGYQNRPQHVTILEIKPQPERLQRKKPPRNNKAPNGSPWPQQNGDDDVSCCREIDEITRERIAKIYTTLACDNFPTKSRTTLTKNQDVAFVAQNYLDIYKNLLLILDDGLGLSALPVTLKIKTDEGQERELKISSLSDAALESLPLLVGTFFDSDNIFSVLTKLIPEMAKIKNLGLDTASFNKALAGILGFNLDRTPRTESYPFDFRKTESWREFNKPWTPALPNRTDWKDADKDSIKAYFQTLIRTTQTLLEAVSLQGSPEQIIGQIRKMTDGLGGGSAKSNQELDKRLAAIEERFKQQFGGDDSLEIKRASTTGIGTPGGN